MASRHETGLRQYKMNVAGNAPNSNTYNKSLSKVESESNKAGQHKAYHMPKEFSIPSKFRQLKVQTRNKISALREETAETMIQDGGLVYGFKKPDIQKAKREAEIKKLKYTSASRQGYHSDSGLFGSGHRRYQHQEGKVLQPVAKTVPDDVDRLERSSVDETSRKKYDPQEAWTGKGHKFTVKSRQILDDSNILA